MGNIQSSEANIAWQCPARLLFSKDAVASFLVNAVSPSLSCRVREGVLHEIYRCWRSACVIQLALDVAGFLV